MRGNPCGPRTLKTLNNKKMKLLKVFAAALLLVGATTAGAADYRLGYCDNTVSIGDQMMSGEGVASYDVAIYLTPEMLAKVAGGQFTGVNIGLNDKFKVSGATAWVRSELTGENLASSQLFEADKLLAKNWNAVKFTTPVDIEAGKGYYVGYTMATKNNATVVMLPVSKDDKTGKPGSCWYRRGEGNWEDLHERGCAFLEALLVSDNLPKLDLTLRDAAFQEEYSSEGETVHLDLTVLNSGMSDVTSFETVLSCPDQNVSITRTVNCELPYGERQTFTQDYVLSGLTPDKEHNFTLTVTKVNGVDDQVPADNSYAIAPFLFVAQLYQRTVLIEEFTTQNCGNCPAAARIVHSSIASFTQELQKRIAVVCHHSGYGEDPFTKACDNDFLWFYNAGGKIYAPALMMDREESYSGSNTPVFQAPSEIGMMNRIRDRLNTPAFLSVNINAKHDPTNRKVEVTVSGKATKRPKTPSIFVYLVEDNVEPNPFQASGGTGFLHSHLIRDYNSQSWGEDPVWSEDGTYTYTCTLTYPAETPQKNGKPLAAAKPQDMEIVAVMANFNDKNPCDNAVENAARLKLSDASTGPISGVDAVAGQADVYVAEGMVFIGSEPADEVYTIAGARVANRNLAPAIYIVRAGGNAYKVSVR